MTEYQNDTPPPGHFIKQELEERVLAQRDLAYILGTTEQVVTGLLNGKHGISPDMAKALGQAFDVNPELFINLQAAYDEAAKTIATNILSLKRPPVPQEDGGK